MDTKYLLDIKRPVVVQTKGSYKSDICILSDKQKVQIEKYLHIKHDATTTLYDCIYLYKSGKCFGIKCRMSWKCWSGQHISTNHYVFCLFYKSSDGQYSVEVKCNNPQCSKNILLQFFIGDLALIETLELLLKIGNTVSEAKDPYKLLIATQLTNDTWSCPQCTFMNDDHFTHCTCCDFGRKDLLEAEKSTRRRIAKNCPICTFVHDQIKCPICYCANTNESSLTPNCKYCKRCKAIIIDSKCEACCMRRDNCGMHVTDTICMACKNYLDIEYCHNCVTTVDDSIYFGRSIN